MDSTQTVLQDEKELKGWLAILSGDRAGKDVPLYEGKTVAGCSPYATVSLRGMNLESFHFSIRIQGGEAFLTDLDSEGGLFIDGKRIFRQTVADETVFKTENLEFLIKLL